VRIMVNIHSSMLGLHIFSGCKNNRHKKISLEVLLLICLYLSFA
jgi:hypothetical protein